MAEKRKNQRTKIIANILIKHNLKKLNGIAYDVSIGGISFVSSQIFEEGDKCKIVVTCEDSIIERSGVIKWRSLVNSVIGMKKYGFGFDEVLLDHQFEEICKNFVEYNHIKN
jgi:hypothetical protein